MRYPPYDIPTLSKVEHLGAFTPDDLGFFGLEQTLDLFHDRGVTLIIQLGEALVPRGTAQNADVDHLRRLLGHRQQAMLVCTNDLGRAYALRRAGGWDAGARIVRPNITHLDPGFSTRLINDDSVIVFGPSLSASKEVTHEPTGSGPTLGEPSRCLPVGLAVGTDTTNFEQVVCLCAPKLLISGGPGAFRDETYRRDGTRTGPGSTQIIVFGERAGQRIDHVIVHLADGTVTLLPTSSRRTPGPVVDDSRSEES